MNKVLYFVTSLKPCGPTNQLFYLNKFIDKKEFSTSIVTIKQQSKTWNIEQFSKVGVQIRSLGFRKLNFFFSLKRVIDIIRTDKPDVVHSSGLLPDLIMSILPFRRKWVSTVRCYPQEDYPDLYGKMIGRFLSFIHLLALRRCLFVVACSESLSKRLEDIGIAATYVRNGAWVDPSRMSNKSFSISVDKPVFIVVGDLIPRKNVGLILEAFRRWRESRNSGTLLIAGNYPENKKGDLTFYSNVTHLGNVKNIYDYLQISDIHVSASLSEGFPNSALEAGQMRKINILSDIPSHLEFKKILPDATIIFSLEKGVDGLLNAMNEGERLLSSFECIRSEMNVDGISAERATLEYEVKYRRLISNLSF